MSKLIADELQDRSSGKTVSVEDLGQLDGKTLGDAATKNVGTSPGTVAAGDDSRITGAAQKSANLSDLDSASNSRDNLGLGTAAVADIVGTVSESAGVPTGAIIERGSNSDGEYVKYADGTALAWIATSITSASTVSDTLEAYPYPVGFVGDVAVSIGGGVDSTGGSGYANRLKTLHLLEVADDAGSWEVRIAEIADMHTSLPSGDTTVAITLLASGRWHNS